MKGYHYMYLVIHTGHIMKSIMISVMKAFGKMFLKPRIRVS